jgi:signal transduction histidine kinase
VALPQLVIDGAAPGVTGVLREAAFGETMELLLQLHPQAKQVFVVAQARAVEGYEERVRSTLSRFSGRVELTYIAERTVPALLAAVRLIPPQSVLLYLRYTPHEATTRIMYPDEVARLVADASPVPIYSASDAYIGSGVVGGTMRTAEGTGAAIGEITRRILEGTPPETIPIVEVGSMPILDWRQLRRWGIDPSRLPSGSQILFRTPTLWEGYRWYFVGTIGLVIVQLALIAALLKQRARRRGAEETIRLREAALRTTYERTRQLAGRLINLQEAARATVAQDLHDDICQQLAVLSIAIDVLKASPGKIQNGAAQRAFAELARLTRETLHRVRHLSHELHPATLGIFGLAAALRGHCDEVAKHHGVQVTFTSQGDLGNLSPEIAICLFRVAQESLRNGVLHGHAHRLAVGLVNAGTFIELTVTDDGRGFDLEAARRNGLGLGLVTMEERTHAVGGIVEVLTGLGQGTTVRVRISVGLLPVSGQQAEPSAVAH